MIKIHDGGKAGGERRVWGTGCTCGGSWSRVFTSAVYPQVLLPLPASPAEQQKRKTTREISLKCSRDQQEGIFWLWAELAGETRWRRIGGEGVTFSTAACWRQKVTHVSNQETFHAVQWSSPGKCLLWHLGENYMPLAEQSILWQV